MGLIDRVLGRSTMPPALPFQDFLMPWMNFNGNTYGLFGLNQTLTGDREEIGGNFVGLAAAYMSNAIVFACEQVRLEAFSEARFQYRRLVKGRPGDLYGDPSLGILEAPWPGGVTGDLLTRSLQYADFGGNSYCVRRPGYLSMMRPDWVGIIVGSNSDDPNIWDIDSKPLGYSYQEGGPAGGKEPILLLPEEVAHFAPIPDPLARFRGMSWLSPVIREIQADNAATTHKQRFFENGATPNMIVKLGDAVNLTNYEEWVAKFKKREPKGADVYKTLYLAAGSDATVVGATLQEVDFKAVQGGGETRIAAAAGTPPVIVGLSEGLAGSSLNAGNYGSARRRFADLTIRPLWRNFAGSMQVIVPPPGGSQLWYDDRDIAFVREDQKDAAEIQQIKAGSIRQLVDAGYKADSVVKAVESEDMSLLVHSGLFSVQLQPPGTTTPPPDTAPTNGAKPVAGATP